MIKKNLAIANVFIKNHFIEDENFFDKDGLGNFLLDITDARDLNRTEKWMKIAEYVIEKYPKEACKELVDSLTYWVEQ